jgi:hypothetical protein
MKKSIVFAASLALFVFATAAFAQKAPADFSGTWNLDTSKGSLGPGGPMIKSQTLTIKQEGNKITLSTKTERNPPPADAPAGGGGGRPGGGGFGGGGGGGEQSFTLDGKEMSMDQPGPGGATIPVKMSGKWDGSKVVLSTSRTMTGQDGTPATSTTKSTYELGADGKSLTVTRDSDSPRGKSSTTSVYAKGA